MASKSDTTDILARLRIEDAEQPWCGESGLFQRAADEIEQLRAAIMSVQRSAFDAGFDAGQDGGIRAWAYEAWAGQQ